jgi:hypothetical protein
MEARGREVVAGMWDAIRDAIESNGRTLRFVLVIAVLVAAAWFISAH